MVRNEGQVQRRPVDAGAAIVLIGNQWESAYRFRSPLFADLQALGLQVHLVGPDTDDVYRQRIGASGVVTHGVHFSRSGMKPLGELSTLLGILSVLRRVRPASLLSYFAKPVIYGSLAGWLARVPQRYSLIAGLGHVFTLGDGVAGYGRRFLVRRLFRVALRTNCRVFFQNDDDRDLFTRQGLVHSEKAVRVNGTGVDLSEYPCCPAPIEPVTFVLAARLLAEKGVREYAAAARILRERGWNCRCVLLGPLDDNPSAIGKAEIDGWLAEGILEWPGSVDDVRPWLQSASVYVLPSYYREGVPRSIQEAMATGRAIITADTPGCRDTIEHGHNGLLVPARRVPELADAMERFLREPELITVMGLRSRSRAESRYDVRRINEGMLRVMGLVDGDARR